MRIPRKIGLRRWVTPCVIALALTLPLALAGCGNSPSSPAATIPKATPTPGSNPPPTSSPAPTATPAGGRPSGDSCTPADLTVTLMAVSGGAGHDGVTLLFTNRSAGTCTLIGYPGTAVLDSSGRQVVQATRTIYGYLSGLSPHTTTPPLVRLDPGQDAAAGLEWVSNPLQTESCPSYASILVTPPNTDRSTTLQLPSTMQLCSGLQIHPVEPGVGTS